MSTAAIQQELTKKVKQPIKRPPAHKCDATKNPARVACADCGVFTPSSQAYAKVARKYEKHTNCVFNGRNLSDHSKVTQFQKLKLQGGVSDKARAAKELD